MEGIWKNEQAILAASPIGLRPLAPPPKSLLEKKLTINVIPLEQTIKTQKFPWSMWFVQFTLPFVQFTLIILYEYCQFPHIWCCNRKNHLKFNSMGKVIFSCIP
jgi:hypothetical protein